MEQDLSKIIKSLIDSHREDDWWDFKYGHHHDKAYLVHDITSMANSRSNRDRYIIFGIEDQTFKIIGVENDTNRRNQQCIVDILRSVGYAGSVRPRIELRTIKLEQHEVDVLIIKNTYDVPYYLEKQYQDKNIKSPEGKLIGRIVRPYHIYTRVVDNNTEIDKNADINDIEYLWRKRFGIDRPPKERLMVLLDDIDKWNVDWGNKKYAYHSDFPEYQLVQSGEWQKGLEACAVFYPNPQMNMIDLNIMYHNTIIHETQLWCFDGGRKYLPKASYQSLSFRPNSGYYSYYLLDSIEGKLLRIFTDGLYYIHNRGPNYNQLIVFQNMKDKESFDKYLKDHFDDYNDVDIKNEYQYIIQAGNKQREDDGESTFLVAKCAKLYEDWLKTKEQK